MALTGNIADWSLADLLQIIAAERKSGTLTLQREDDEVHLDFTAGLLVGASEHRTRAAEADSKRQSARLLTGRRGAAALGAESPGGFLAFLVTSGRVRPEQARAVILLAHETSADTVSALLKGELMTHEALEEAMTAYAQDLFTRVLTWESGDYTFAAAARAERARGAARPGTRADRPGGAQPSRPTTTAGAAGTVALNTDGLLLEGMRRIDEQPRIAAVVQPETVFTRAEGDRPIPADLGRREAKLLALVDGRRDTRSLAPLAQLGEYEAAEALYNLHQGGFIVARDGDNRAAIVPRTLLPAERPHASFLQVVALAMVLAVSLAFRLGGASLFLPGMGSATVAAPLPAREESALRFAEALFVSHHGRPATSAEELVRAGLLPGGFGRWDGAVPAPAASPPPPAP